MKSLDIDGVWFLPGKDNHVAGKLVFAPNTGAKLSLVGSFYSAKDFAKRNTEPIILGIPTKGDLITLVNCHNLGMSLNSSGLNNSTFQPQEIFIGCHFSDTSDRVFDKVMIRFQNFETWMGDYPFSTELKWNEQNQNELSCYNLVFTAPPKLKIDFDSFTLETTHSMQGPSSDSNSPQLKYHRYFSLSFPEKLSLPDILEYVASLQHLVTLGVGKTSFPKEIILFRRDFFTKGLKGKEIPRPIDYFFSQTFFSQAEEVAWHQMVFRFPSIAKNFKENFSNWLGVRGQYIEVFHLYWSASTVKQQYLEARFLTLAQAIELLHRKTQKGNFLPKAEFTPVKKLLWSAIPKELDSEFQSRMKDGISHLNEYSLKQRVDDLVENLSKNDLWIKENDWATKIKDTRNFLAHFSDNAREKACHGWELYNLAKVAQYLLEASILLAIGFDLDVIKNIRKTLIDSLIEIRNDA